MRHKAITLILIALVLLTSVSNAYSQSSERSTQESRAELIEKAESAVAEVERARAYISDLETTLAEKSALTAKLEQENKLSKDEIALRKKDADELRNSIAALKAALAYRIDEIEMMRAKLTKAESGKRFWKKVAGIMTVVSAVATAAVVLKN